MNKSAFFASLRADKRVFGKALGQSQVNGIEAILDECAHLKADTGQTAYILATAYGETGGKMQPARENMNYSAKRLRQVWPSRFPTMEKAKKYAYQPQALARLVYNGRMGNIVGSDDGWRFRGNGIGQITGRSNHALWGKRIGVPLEDKPELMEDLKVSVKALARPMLEGWATGKALPDFVSGSKRDYLNARQVWNGMFEAKKYAEAAEAFEQALRAGSWGTRPPVLPDVEPVEAEKGGLVAALLAILRQLFVKR